MIETEVIQPMTTAEIESGIGQFIRLYQDGIDSIKMAGELLCRMVDHDPHVTDYIIQRCPALTPTALSIMEQVGRGLIHAPLAMDPSPGARSLRKLPLSLQVKFETEPIPVVVINGKGESDVLLIRHKDMTPDQIRQVFRGDRVATEGEQRAWIADRDSKLQREALKAPHTPWKVSGRKVIVLRACELSTRDLKNMLAALEKTAP